MKRAKHRPKGQANDRYFDIAAWVRQVTRRGYPSKEAQERAADVFGCETRTVQRALEAHEKTKFSSSADWESYFLVRATPKPLPKRRKK